MTFLNIFSKKRIKKTEPIKIIVDTREKQSKLIPELINQKFKIEFKHLPIADYIINNTAIERKTISDLKSSIINKRIIKQIKELKQFPSHIILIEGITGEIYSPPLHENALRGFLLSLAIDYKIPIIFTLNSKDTAKYFYILAKKKKIDNISIRPSKILLSNKEKAQFILEGFPNIGPVKAKKLLKKFKSLKNIINAPFQEIQPIIGKKTKEFESLIKEKIKI